VYAERIVSGQQTLEATCMPRVETILKFELGADLRLVTPTGDVVTSPSNVVVGAFGSAAVREMLRPGTRSFVIFFRPSGFTRLFGVPMALNTNVAHAGEEVVGSELRSLHERIAEAPSFAARVQLAEALLVRRIGAPAARMPMLDAADQILRVGGAARIERVAQAFDCTLRHFEREFSKSTGFSPKRFARLCRFQWAIDLKLTNPDRSWCSIAHALHYHDQMHLVHEFEQLGGASPTQVLAMLGHSRPQTASSQAL
jgi:AraC-like DNA-binding protein